MKVAKMQIEVFPIFGSPEQIQQNVNKFLLTLGSGYRQVIANNDYIIVKYEIVVEESGR